ncbi:hypothetical protein [Litorihabitans aurantiacus]|uniref:Uncharacterized protein n=1 Tax=Litorihabitans aurantiacus TaxID=1930061 RepID=A0AA37XI60_9MICO|nr:hypothetical protein [Litorihabitans aurantiacus]GMA33669.1 hypothetical protein GCM10025875_36610 [Litorihabitans aurantiacus]GMA33738.1 hypothetical protein GCM10025875_37300 [Litorihabitans aurantiacus]
MRTTAILGPVTRRPYPAIDTGERWNGSPVVGFTSATMLDFIHKGDGRDANGEGIQIRDGLVFDRSADDEGDGEPVPVVIAAYEGQGVALFVPTGRVWEEVASGYTSEDGCRACGAHISEPHSPACPAA